MRLAEIRSYQESEHDNGLLINRTSSLDILRQNNDMLVCKIAHPLTIGSLLISQLWRSDDNSVGYAQGEMIVKVKSCEVLWESAE
jgi:hypothetical protein